MYVYTDRRTDGRTQIKNPYVGKDSQDSNTHYLFYAPLVSYVAFVGALVLKLPSSKIVCKFHAFIPYSVINETSFKISLHSPTKAKKAHQGGL